MPKPQRLLGFDYGSQWIGVAVGQTLTASASELPALAARDGVPDWQQVGKLIEEWQPDRLIIGLPLNIDDSESEMSRRARKFANRLHGRFGIAIEMMDERLSSFAARGEIIEATGSRDFKQQGVDSIAARLILESWLSTQPSA